MRIPALLAAAMIAAPASAQSGVPEAIKTRVNELVARCAQAGGTLGSMTGQGRFVIPADFSGDGRTVVFVTSLALSPWEANGKLDVYALDRATGSRAQLSVTAGWQQGIGDSILNAAYVTPAISGDGYVAAFGTEVGLDPTDRNDRFDVYVRAARRPVVSSVTPATVAPGSIATLEVAGDAFLAGAVVGIDLPGAPGVHVTEVEVLAEVVVVVSGIGAYWWREEADRIIDFGATAGPRPRDAWPHGSGRRGRRAAGRAGRRRGRARGRGRRGRPRGRGRRGPARSRRRCRVRRPARSRARRRGRSGPR